MTRKSYEVSSPHIGVIPSKASDSSFRTCLCTMLVVLVICVLLLLLAFTFRSFGSQNKQQEEQDNIKSIAQYGDKIDKTTISSKQFSNSTQASMLETLNDTTRYDVNSTIGKQETSTSKLVMEGTTEYRENNTTGHDDNSSTQHQETTTANIDISKEFLLTETRKSQKSDTNARNSSTKMNVVTNPTPEEGKTAIRHSEDYIEPGEVDLRSSSENPMSVQNKNIERFITRECNATICISTAARMIGSMDLSKTPCENFYGFACGGVSGYEEEEINIFTQKILEGNGRPDFVDKFNIFYKSCLNHEDRFHYRDRVEEAKALLHTIGSFQFEGNDTINNLTDFIGNLILLKTMPLFDVDIDIDPENGTYILKLIKPDQTSLNLDQWSSFSEDKRKCIRMIEETEQALSQDISLIHEKFIKCQLNYSDYLDSIDTSVRELGFFSNLTEEAENKHILDIRRFIEWYILSMIDKKMFLTVAQEEIITRKHEKITVGKLEEKFSFIKWKRLFSLITNIHVNNETVVLLHDIDYFTEVVEVFDQRDQRSLNNAFLAILAKSLFHNGVLPTHRHSRMKYCRESSRELMPDILNYIYKTQIADQEILESNNYVEEIYDSLKKQFSISLENATWLDKLSKISIEKKLDNIELVLFVTSDVFIEENFLKNYYADLNLKQDNYQTNLFNLMKYSRKRLLSLHSQKVTPENMYRNFVDVTKKEPVFFYTSNIVCIPYGMSKKVKEELPNYIILAQLGFSLAKILGYSFDSIGMRYQVELQNSAQQIFDEFLGDNRDTIDMSNPINFGDRKLNFTLYNSLSQSERIAENTALQLLEDYFITLKKEFVLPWISEKFSLEKIFLLALNQAFCRKMSLMEFTIQATESPILPPQFRMENILSHSKLFLEEFRCAPGSGMIRMDSGSRFPYLENKTMDYNDL